MSRKPPKFLSLKLRSGVGGKERELGNFETQVGGCRIYNDLDVDRLFLALSSCNCFAQKVETPHLHNAVKTS